MIFSSGLAGLGELIFALIMFVVVVALCYFTTHFIGSYQKRRLEIGNFAVVDMMKVANNKFIAIVKAGRDNYYIIGVGKDEITFIDKIDKDDITLRSDKDPHLPAGKADFGSFKDMFMKYAGRGKENTKD